MIIKLFKPSDARGIKSAKMIISQIEAQCFDVQVRVGRTYLWLAVLGSGAAIVDLTKIKRTLRFAGAEVRRKILSCRGGNKFCEVQVWKSSLAAR